MRKKSAFRHESLQDAKSIRKILESVTEGLSKGTLKFSDEDDEVILEPEGLMRLKLSASKDDNRNSISLKVSWETDSELKEDKNLEVSSKK